MGLGRNPGELTLSSGKPRELEILSFFFIIRGYKGALSYWVSCFMTVHSFIRWERPFSRSCNVASVQNAVLPIFLRADCELYTKGTKSLL